MWKQWLIEDYKSGKSCKEILQETNYGISISQMQRILKQAGVLRERNHDTTRNKRHSNTLERATLTCL